VKLFKNDSGKVSGNQWTQRWSGTEPHIINDTDWASPQVRTLEITQDYTTRPIVIVVRKFVPQPGDQLHRRWVDGGIEKKAQIPPYAVADLETTIQTYKTYINEEGPAHFHSALNPADHLIWETYSMAIHTSNYTSVSSIVSNNVEDCLHQCEVGTREKAFKNGSSPLGRNSHQHDI
jgi:hypothetical protein